MSDDREMFIPATGVSRSRALELAGWYDNNPIVQALKEAEYDRGVAAGRRQAADLVDYVRIQHQTLGLHDHMGANLSCHGCGLLYAAVGAPAEPVEGD